MYISLNTVVAIFFAITTLKYLVIALCPDKAWRMMRLKTATAAMKKWNEADQGERIVMSVTHHIAYAISVVTYALLAWYLL